jgi:long-chain fatty acid transport protein
MRRITLSLLMTAALLPATVSANPLDAFGFGARGMSLGGAMTAIARDFSANYYNPAGLASGEDLRIEIGYMYNDPTLTMNGNDQNVDRSYGVQAGVVMPGQIGTRTLAFSVGLHLPAERITRIRALPQRQPQWVVYDNRPQRLVITTSAAFEIVEWLYVGAGVTFLSNTEGSLDMSGLVSLTDAEETALFSGVDVNLSSVRYLSAGLLVTPGDNFRAGLSFRDEFELALNLDVNVEGDIAPLEPGAPPVVEGGRFDLKTLNSNLFSPRQLTLGLAWEEPRWLVSADVSWLQWSRFPPPASEIQIELDLDPLDFAVPPSDAPLNPEFDDIFTARVGGEYVALQSRYLDLTTRAGYFFEPTPAPDQPGQTNYIDSSRHGASLGLGFAFHDFSAVFPRPLLFDVAAQFIGLREREYVKDDPADPIGDIVSRGHIWGFSSTIGFLF